MFCFIWEFLKTYPESLINEYLIRPWGTYASFFGSRKRIWLFFTFSIFKGIILSLFYIIPVYFLKICAILFYLLLIFIVDFFAKILSINSLAIEKSFQYFDLIFLQLNYSQYFVEYQIPYVIWLKKGVFRK